MSALYGFLGPPDEKLLRCMGDLLVHRGRQATRCPGLAGSLALAPDERGVSARRVGGGVWTQDGLTLALAGFLTETPKPEPEDPFDIRDQPLALLAARYRRQGLDALAPLRGAFVLALLDGETLHLARDGAGQRTLYHAKIGPRLCFAVEPKALWGLPGFSRRIRPAALAQYFSFSFVPGSGTMLADLHEVEPGCIVSFGPDGQPRTQRFFRGEEGDPALLDHAGSDDALWTEAFRQRLAAAVERRMARAEPLVAFLSGGIDSSVAVHELTRLAPGRVKTFAIHFGRRYPNELEFARAVAERCGADHHEVEIQPRDFLPNLRRVIWHLDDPIGDPVTMPNFELARRVADTAPAVFNGEGGDPCFGGPKNIPMMLHHWYGDDRSPGHLERAYLASYRRAYEEWPRLLTPAWRDRIDPRSDLEALLTPFFKASDGDNRLLPKLLAINVRLKGGHLILPKVERMLGAWGLTPLSPLFDESMIQLAFSAPSRLILDRGVEKVVMKQAYRDVLPTEVIARPKSGMRVPVHFWFQGELRRYARKILSRRALRQAGIFEPDRVRQLLRYDLEQSQGRYGIRLWMLITFEIWRRIVIEGEPV